MTDPARRSLSLVGRLDFRLRDMFMREVNVCDVLECAHGLSMWLLEQSESWLEGSGPADL